MTDLHLLIATAEKLTPERVDELFGLDGVRAFSDVAFGGRATIAYVSATESTLSSTAEATCPQSIPNCLDYLVNQIGSVLPCSLPERACNVHALLTLRPGGRRDFARLFTDLEGPLQERGLGVAAAHLFGSGPHHAVVEVTGDSQADVAEALLDLLDNDLVMASETNVVLPEGAHKWGRVLGVTG